MKIGNKIKRMISVLLTGIMVVALLPMGEFGGKASAATETAKKVACLATGAIKAPAAPADKESLWTGSYVWYGKYEGDPVRYRVLDPKTTIYGGTTMLLDCDSVLYRAVFDADRKPNEGATFANEWEFSDVKKGLNGSEFLTKSNGFTAIERKSIANSKIDWHSYYSVETVSDYLRSWFAYSVELTGEKVFLLDVEDVVNPEYGYTTDDGISDELGAFGMNMWYQVKNRQKKVNKDEESHDSYWLRSAYHGGEYCNASYASFLGDISHPRVEIEDGVSPAFNVNLSSIIFSSVVKGTAGKDNAEYKLTLADSGITAAVPSGKKLSSSGSKVMVPYTVSGSNASKVTQMSILILDKEYKAGNTNNAKIKYYGKLNTSGSFTTTGTGTFDLPSSLSLNNWGITYYVYLLAEDVNGKHESDYASAPVVLPAPGAPVISKQPQNTTSVAGSIAKISVTASGTGTLTYQWQSKAPNSNTWTNSQQTGATTATLSVATNVNHNGYQFRCIVRNNGVPVISDAATMTAKGVTGLCTSIIKAPAAGVADKAWTGSYVWYGRYDGEPLKYRVLTPRTTKYGATTMLLDCDSILYRSDFNGTELKEGAQTPNEWAYSDIKAELNGSAFLTKANGFSTLEKNAIAYSKITGHTSVYAKSEYDTENYLNNYLSEFAYVSLNGERVFLLDFEDVMNTGYGYAEDVGYHMFQEGNSGGVRYEKAVINHLKKSNTNTDVGWWLRSYNVFFDTAIAYVCNGIDDIESSDFEGKGNIFYRHVRSFGGVSPAFNVKLYSVLFSSVVSGTAGKDNAEYKLTITDSNLSVALQSGKSMTMSGRKVTVPYTITGSDAPKANMVSVLILDKEFKGSNSNNAKILYYGELALSSAFSTTGTGTFELPSSLARVGWGSSYHVYLIAEDVNGKYETDYASTPVELMAASVTYTPVISTQPKSTTVSVTSTANFSVAAYGVGTLSYQWQCKAPGSSTWTNSTQSGATTANLSVATNVNHNGYQYRCIVKSACGRQTTSSAVTLTITPKVTTQPLSQSVAVGNMAVFKVVAKGKDTMLYQWQCKAPGSSTWTNSTQTGATTTELSVKTNINHNGYQYRCIVTDGNGKKSYSNAATLIILPRITTQPVSKTVTVGTTVTFTVAATGKETLTYQWQYKAANSNTWKNSEQSGATTAKLSLKISSNHSGYQYRCAVTDGNGKTSYSNAASVSLK